MKRTTKPPNPPPPLPPRRPDARPAPLPTAAEELELRAAAPTLPIVATPAIAWDPPRGAPPSGLHGAVERARPSAPLPASPPEANDAPWRGAAPNVTGPHLPVQLPAPPPAPPPPPYRSAGAASGSSPSGPREAASARASSTSGPAVSAGGMPVGYVVASAFFLAIAAVGFGLWLAFDVISL